MQPADERDVLRALAACLASRPVALVSTISRDGVANAAPFSMVTPLSASPALLGLAIHPRSDGRRKRTLASIEEVGDFVVNAVTLALLPAAVESSVDAPEGRPVAGLRFVPSDLVRSPRVAASPINLECRLAEVFRPARSGESRSEVPCAYRAVAPWPFSSQGSEPRFRASNNWVVAPRKSASGRAVLANDPPLGHGLPALWYEAHLKSKTQDVAGVTLPGLPFVVLGHNQDVAWGFTNVMQDAADFFVERIDPQRPDRVMHEGEWVPITTRRETIRVQGGEPVSLEVRLTPHGPILSDVLPEEKEVLAYRWTLHAAEHANEVEGFWMLNRARNWDEFRAALARFGAVAQNAAYADQDGHIGLQTTGAFPRLRGRADGTRFRVGWDGSEEWDGFHAFAEHPVTFDPPRGWLASANNPTVAPPAPFYISSQWEPVDRIVRIREVLESKQELSVEDMRRLQITDFADLDRALSVIPGGQSGIPASPHYDDQIPLWLSGQYHTLPLERGAAESGAAHRLVLTPAP